MIQLFRTVTSRLTGRFVVLLALLFSLVILLLYHTVREQMKKRMDAKLLIEAIEFDTVFASSDRKNLERAYLVEGDAEGSKRVFLRLFSPQGDMLASSNLSEFSHLPALSKDKLLSYDEKPSWETVELPGRSDLIRIITKRNRDGNIFQMGVSLSEDVKFINTLAYHLLLAMAVLSLAGAVIGWLTAKQAMAGVERIARAASKIGRSDLDFRVPLGEEGEEIRLLAQCFNGMLKRIETLVAELREVTDNIAHDLRSPITRIRGTAETTIMADPDESEYREMAGTVIEESDQLIVMINTMLDIAKSEALGLASMEPVDLASVASEAVDIFQPYAEQVGVRIDIQQKSEPIYVCGEKAKLQRVLSNLMDNAIKFSGREGHVSVSVDHSDDEAIIAIADDGCGIKEEHLNCIFDRFFRADASRTTPGSGLGLCLAKAYISSHKGTIEVQSEFGKGSVFTIHMPLCSTNLQISKK